MPPRSNFSDYERGEYRRREFDRDERDRDEMNRREHDRYAFGYGYGATGPNRFGGGGFQEGYSTPPTANPLLGGLSGLPPHADAGGGAYRRVPTPQQPAYVEDEDTFSEYRRNVPPPPYSEFGNGPRLAPYPSLFNDDFLSGRNEYRPEYHPHCCFGGPDYPMHAHCCADYYPGQYAHYPCYPTHDYSLCDYGVGFGGGLAVGLGLGLLSGGICFGAGRLLGDIGIGAVLGYLANGREGARWGAAAGAAAYVFTPHPWWLF